ncbi:hypothetical protein SVAN01_08626 [Stagonosporopsis vannaccii]|nr:hypothetical protein SVAN01_08626 [Stagonosporopsis vannaccii]
MSGPLSPPLPPTTATPTTTTTHALPLGFCTQLKALQETQLQLTQRITALERENAALKAGQRPPLPTLHSLDSRISALESHTRHLALRRREAVSTLLNLRSLNLDAANAFQLRAEDIQDDDLEGMLGVWAMSVMTVVSGLQVGVGQLSGRGVLGGRGPWIYPRGYVEGGWCVAHRAVYPCPVCGV